MLRFAIASSVFLGVAFLQYVWAKMVTTRFFENKIAEFVDLCSISNVSVFIMAEPYYGFYIHGRSVHGRADTDMAEMNEQLKKEEEDLVGKRGLLPNTDTQTFEMHLPDGLRDEYDRVFLQLVEEEKSARVQDSGRMGHVQSKAGSRGVSEKTIHAYAGINRFLASFIDHSLKDIDYTVREKQWLERLLSGAPPIRGKGVFYSDPEGTASYERAIFYGHELTLLIFDLLLFCILDLWWTNFVAAGAATYFVDAGVGWLRDTYGRKQIASRCLVDSRFLI